MPGTATLTANLVNELAVVADDLRALYGEFGVDQWSVWRCTRSWSGTRRGEGSLGSETATQILPTPRIGWADGSGRIRFDLHPGGLEEAGQIVLTEISLTYTEAELSGQTATATQEVYYKLVDAQGNGMATRYFVVHRPPVPDRDKGIGWILTLNARTDPA